MSTKKEEQKQYSRSSNTTNPQEAKKEVEKITDDAKKRKEATTIAKKLETRVEESEGKNQAMIKILDESKDNIRQAIKETIAEIPRFTKIVQDFQETAMETAKEISDAFIESQRQVISSLQLIPSRDISASIWSYWTFQPIIANMYLSMFRITVDTAIATNRLAKNLIFTNLEAARALMPQLKDNANELPRLSADAAKTFEQT
jgi:chemotaxis protein histidine kinase CheA